MVRVAESIAVGLRTGGYQVDPYDMGDAQLPGPDSVAEFPSH